MISGLTKTKAEFENERVEIGADSCDQCDGEIYSCGDCVSADLKKKYAHCCYNFVMVGCSIYLISAYTTVIGIGIGILSLIFFIFPDPCAYFALRTRQLY